MPPTPPPENPRLVFALTGPPGAGKGEVAAALRAWAEGKGWTVGHLSFSDQIKAELLARGVPEGEVSRELLTQTATEMRAAEGPGVLAKRIVRRILDAPPAERSALHIVEAVRHVREIDHLKEAFGRRFCLVSVEADYDEVARRILARARPDESREAMDGPTAARKLLEKEMGGYSGPNAFNIAKCMEKADIRIQNNGTLKDLREAVLTAVAQMG